MESRDVFVSYHMDSSLKIVEKIVSSLENEDISCWYAPRNCSQKYAEAIVSAIRQCRVFLFILNKESNISEHVLNEINCAFERYKNHEDIILLPFRVDDCELSDDVYYYLGRIHMMNGTLPPVEFRINELVDRIKGVLKHETALYSSKTAGDALIKKTKNNDSRFAIVGTRVYPDNKFVGRTNELKDIKNGFDDCGNVIFLVGMGGIGKSEIAKKYARTYADDYSIVLWINFEKSLCHTIANDNALTIQNMSRSDYPEDDEKSWFQRKCRTLKELANDNVLIIIDNFDIDDDPDLEWFCNGSYHVLFTTRNHRLSDSYKEIEVGAMNNQDELLSLFLSEYKREVDDNEIEIIKKIILLTNRHTLTIRLIASAMQSRRIKAKDMLSLLEKNELDLQECNRQTSDIIYGRLKQVFKISSISNLEQEILILLSLIPLRGIIVEELYNLAERNDFETIDNLIRKSWVIHNPVTDVVYLHPLISKISETLFYENPNTCVTFVTNLVKVCDQKKTKIQSQQRVRDLHNYLYYAYTKLPLNAPYYRLVTDAVVSAYIDDKRFSEALELLNRIFSCETDDIKKPYLYHRISQVQVAMGDIETCAATALEGCRFMEGLCFDGLPMDVKYMKKVLLQRLGEAYMHLSQYELAIQYGTMAVDICDRYDFTDPELSKGWALLHLATTLYVAEKLVDSECNLNIAMQLFTSINDEWSLSFCHMLKCRIESKKGNFDTAIDYLDKVWIFRKMHCGINSLEHADYLKQLADIYQNQGKITQAIPIYKNAAEIYNQHHSFKNEQLLRDIIHNFENE